MIYEKGSSETYQVARVVLGLLKNLLEPFIEDLLIAHLGLSLLLPMPLLSSLG